MKDGLISDIYCKPPKFTVMPQGKYLTGGPQSDCTVNLIGVQVKYVILKFANSLVICIWCSCKAELKSLLSQTCGATGF